MPDLLELIRAVHSGCLIERGVDTSQRSDIDNGAPTCFLPDADEIIDRAEVFRVAQKFQRRSAELFDDLIDGAARHQELIENRNDDDAG